MAVVSCKEIASGRDGSFNYRGRNSYTRRFRVVTNSPYDSAATVKAASGIPAFGTPYATTTESDPLAFCSDIRATQGDDELVWLVDVQYTSVADVDGGGGSGEPGDPARDPTQRAENPLERPVVWSLDFVEEQEPVFQDKAGNPYQNTAGLQFARTRTQFVPEITATKNYATFPFSLALQYNGKVNKDNWKGFRPKQAKICGIQIRSAFENNVGFVTVTWKIRLKPNSNGGLATWDPVQILDKGPFYIDPVSNAAVPFVDAGGNQYEGLLLGPGGGGDKLPNGAAPQYLTFEEHEQINFKGIL